MIPTGRPLVGIARLRAGAPMAPTSVAVLPPEMWKPCGAPPKVNPPDRVSLGRSAFRKKLHPTISPLEGTTFEFAQRDLLPAILFLSFSAMRPKFRSAL